MLITHLTSYVIKKRKRYWVFNMKFLFIIGGSGSGKTSLAKMLQENNPDRFKFIKGTTTRPRREDETDDDYEFISEEQYDADLENKLFIGQSIHVMSPNKYGYRKTLLDDEKTNILIVSIEGFLNAVHERTLHDTMSLCYINSDKPFVDRENRDFSAEDRFNKGVLAAFLRENGDETALYINSRVIKLTAIKKENIQRYYEQLTNIK